MSGGLETDWPFWISLGGRTTVHCAGGPTLIAIYAGLCLLVGAGYFWIAVDWLYRARHSRNSDRRRASLRLLWIFVLCGFCGYLMPVIKVFVPAWSLHIALLVVLNWITWRYALNLKRMATIYTEMEHEVAIVAELREAVGTEDLTERLRKASQALERTSRR